MSNPNVKGQVPFKGRITLLWRALHGRIIYVKGKAKGYSIGRGKNIFWTGGEDINLFPGGRLQGVKAKTRRLW